MPDKMTFKTLPKEDTDNMDSKLEKRIEELAEMLRRNDDTMDVGGVEGQLQSKRLKSLPDFDLLFDLKKSPEQLYQKALDLRIDRNVIEEKIMTPLRRAIACSIDFRSIVNHGERMIRRKEDEGKDRNELMNESLADLLSYLVVLQVNILKYDRVPGE